jgi:oligosaccharide repeat unit polymerase
MKFPIEYAVFTEPYMYVVMNLENFVRSSQLLDAHTYGFYSFNSVMSLTGLKHWIEGYWNLDEAPFIIGGYNTYSFLWTYYRDFGIPGLMAFPLIEGSVIAHLYYRMRRNPGVHTVSLYGLAVFTMVISFFFNVLSMLQFIVIVAMVYIVSKAADGRRSRFVIRRG